MDANYIDLNKIQNCLKILFFNPFFKYINIKDIIGLKKRYYFFLIFYINFYNITKYVKKKKKKKMKI